MNRNYIRRFVGAYVLCLCVYFAPLVNAQPAPCTATDGPGIAKCVQTAYPEKLKANVTLAQRTANASFLRDRVIETARCAMLDVGLNLKRGGPAISVDFIAWRNGDITEGVDIIGGWDDLSRTLSLGWHRYSKAESYGFPTYKAYGPVSCLGQPEPTPVPEPTPTPAPTVDLQPILNALSVLQGELASLRAELAKTNARIAESEAFDNKLQSAQDAMQNTLVELKSRKIPSGCTVQFLRCRLTE